MLTGLYMTLTELRKCPRGIRRTQDATKVSVRETDVEEIV
jgi:hypothetical protein